MARWPTDGLNHHGMHAGETRGETQNVYGTGTLMIKR